MCFISPHEVNCAVVGDCPFHPTIRPLYPLPPALGVTGVLSSSRSSNNISFFSSAGWWLVFGVFESFGDYCAQPISRGASSSCSEAAGGGEPTQGVSELSGMRWWFSLERRRLRGAEIESTQHGRDFRTWHRWRGWGAAGQGGGRRRVGGRPTPPPRMLTSLLNRRRQHKPGSLVHHLLRWIVWGYLPQIWKATPGILEIRRCEMEMRYSICIDYFMK